MPTKGHDYEQREMLLAIVDTNKQSIRRGTMCSLLSQDGERGSTWVNMGQHGWWLSCRQGAAIY